MKLLLDENLVPGSYPVCKRRLPAEGIWKTSGDKALRGAPPKVLVLAVSNGGNVAVLSALVNNRARIEAFDVDAQESLLVFRGS